MDIKEIVKNIKDNFYNQGRIQEELFKKSLGFKLVLQAAGIKIDSFGDVISLDRDFIALLKNDPDISKFMDELVNAVKQNLVDQSMKKRIMTKLHTDIRNKLKYSVHSELVDTLTEQLKNELITELTEEFNNSTEYKVLKLEMSLNDSKN